MVRVLLAVVVFVRLTGLAAAQERKPGNALDDRPVVTAKAWAVGDGKTGELLQGFEAATPRPIASTTKIMTAWIVLQLVAADARVLDETVPISERADKTSGSSASIVVGEKYRVRELLYGLLLPSGNDAATAFAEHFGPRLRTESKQEGAETDALASFVAAMNRRAEALKLSETHYLDPHGLKANRSSARDLLRLTATALRDPLFARYVQTREHRGQAVQADGSMREVVWRNTNQLLKSDGFDGVKTGTTSAAGACLVASGRRGDEHLLVVVLGSTSSDARYSDTRSLFSWAWKHRDAKVGK